MPKPGGWLGVMLWLVAAALAVGAMMFQERTGPSKDLRGSFEVDGQSYHHALTRSGSSAEDERVSIPNPGGGIQGTLHYKRHKTDDQLTAVPLRVEGDELVAELPRQPAAGKLEYTIVLVSADGSRIRVPDQEASVVIRGEREATVAYAVVSRPTR